MSDDLLLLLTPLRQSLERIERKALPLLNDPGLLDQGEGQDLLDVICMQFLAAGEALKRYKPQAAVGFANRVVVVGMERRHLSWQKGRLDSKGTRPNVLRFSVRW